MYIYIIVKPQVNDLLGITFVLGSLGESLINLILDYTFLDLTISSV